MIKLIRFIIPLVVIVSTVVTVSCKKDRVPPSIITADCPDTVHFASQIAPMITTNCIGCHGAGGFQPTLTNYTEISDKASEILGTLQGTPQLMPQGGPALNDTLIQQFKCWINQGKQNN